MGQGRDMGLGQRIRIVIHPKFPTRSDSVVAIAAAVRIMSMIGIAIAQEATATTILSSSPADSSSAVDAVIRHERRMRYKRWLWWTRFGMVITVLQFLGATYLMFIILKSVSHSGKSSWCFIGADPKHNGRERILLVSFLILVWFLVIAQCLAGSDVLRWRSFYATHDNAWKAHYREVFDHGIREVLCCLGRVKYLSVLEEDEVYSVARLLGDLVAYRASGTGHLELLAGLALLQRHRPSTSSDEDLMEAPEELIREAAAIHQFAEAAYTGPLLDFGRNPILFPCAWLYRQGVVTPWTRNRRPVLEGDNWWRGHAAAFLKYVSLPPEALRQGRVSQAKCEAAYFVVVLHHLRSVVIAVRGTETPEDLITDGLCSECTLSMKDLDGLISSDNVTPTVKQRVISSFPHYGHSGIVETARNLFMQIDGQPENKDSQYDATGFLSSLMGAGCECHGYNVRIVGHSLGGSISALLGIMLYGRFPNLHVYSYGPLPCVDSIVAEACSDFVTSIVYNDEFSARLSVNSILRLRAAAITALSEDSAADSAMICKLARRVLQVSSYRPKEEAASAPSLESGAMTSEDGNHHVHRRRHYKYAIQGSGEQDQEFPDRDVTDYADNQDTAILKDSFDEYSCCNTITTCSSPSFEVAEDVITCEDPVSEFMHVVPSSSEASVGDPPEMYLPGLVIHIIPRKKSIFPVWKGWRFHERSDGYKAYIANRESFKDIIVSPFMFLDHLPWRCHYAMQKVLETRQAQSPQDLSNMV
ncbi:Lipase [Macleaya cordata]|uniref:Lipase n=1 Tax=Macleaya cordata TaxID=56857 RepID=A0A200R8K7_MACCD|nr:Lipase [Macleaya cordata]